MKVGGEGGGQQGRSGTRDYRIVVREAVDELKHLAFKLQLFWRVLLDMGGARERVREIRAYCDLAKDGIRSPSAHSSVSL